MAQNDNEAISDAKTIPKWYYNPKKIKNGDHDIEQEKNQIQLFERDSRCPFTKDKTKMVS
jgi:hypothetical protein